MSAGSMEELQKLAEAAGIDFKELMAEIATEIAPVTPPKARKVSSLPGRENLRVGKYVCHAMPGTGIEWAGFSWTPTEKNPSTGAIDPVPMDGCGRKFRTKTGLTVKHVAAFSDKVLFPYGCLSKIVPMHKRNVS